MEEAFAENAENYGGGIGEMRRRNSGGTLRTRLNGVLPPSVVIKSDLRLTACTMNWNAKSNDDWPPFAPVALGRKYHSERPTQA
jgi:hypothetical protein